MSKHINNKNNRGANHNVSNVRNQVKKIKIHHRFHEDEALAEWQARRYGKDIFPGVETAQRVILRKELKETYDGDLYLGIGGTLIRPRGIVIDEHVVDGRLQDTCTAVMTAQRLRVCDKPRLKELLAEALEHDSKGKVPSYHLAALITAMHRVKGGWDQDRTMLWAHDAFDAIVYGDKDESFSLRQEWNQYLADKDLFVRTDKDKELTREEKKAIDNHQTVLGRVWAVVNASISKGKDSVTDISNIASRMRPSIRYAWLGKVFDILVEDARMHQAALNTNFEFVEIATDSGTATANCMVSENEHAAKACNSVFMGKPDMVIVRNPKNGHTFIGCDAAKDEAFLEGFGWLCTMLRMKEYKVRTGRWLPLEAAQGLGTVPGCPNICMSFENQILNGSLTHPDVEGLKLSIEEVVAIAKSAFSAVLRDEWLRQYAGQKPQFKPKAPAVVEPKLVPLEEMIDPSVVISLDVVLDEAMERKNAHR